jgi:hypothetical protein
MARLARSIRPAPQVNVGDWHLSMMAPYRLGPKNLFGAQMLEREFKSLSLLVPLADGLAGDHNYISENLLGEIPMLRGGATSNVGRRE